MIIYLDKDFRPVDEDNALLAKVIPDDESKPYFINVGVARETQLAK